MAPLTFEDLASFDALAREQGTHHGLHLDDLLNLQLILPAKDAQLCG